MEGGGGCLSKGFVPLKGLKNRSQRSPAESVKRGRAGKLAPDTPLSFLKSDQS